MKASFAEKSFQAILTLLLIVVSLTMLFPLVHVIAVSLSARFAVEANQVTLLPVDFTTASWKYILARPDIWKSLGVNVFITVVGTFLALLLSSLLAYPLSRSEFHIGKAVMLGVLFTMIFQAPMIPYFLTIKAMGMLDSIWAMIIPNTISAFNLIIIRTFFQQLPGELTESAKIDGAGDFGILFRIVLPLSKPVLATMGLFYAVVFWNTFYHALLFIRKASLYPLQMKIREFITNSDSATGLSSVLNAPYNAMTLQAAVIIFATVPIILVYPFLQKYFISGALVGAVKE